MSLFNFLKIVDRLSILIDSVEDVLKPPGILLATDRSKPVVLV